MFPMHQDLGWSITLIAGAASAGAVASTFLSPITGWTVDRYGARNVLTISIILLGLTTFLTGWAVLPILFYITYGIGRLIFNSPIQIGSSVIVSRWFVRKRGRANGILSFCHSIGMIGFPVMSSILIAAYGWQVTWHLLGISVWIFGLLPTFLLLQETPESIGLLPDGDLPLENSDRKHEVGSEQNVLTLRKSIKITALWQLGIGGGLLYLIHSGVNTHLALHLQTLGFNAGIAAVAVSTNAVFTGIGSLAWGWLIERLPARFCYATVAGIMALSSLLFMSIVNAPQAIIVSALFGVSLGGMLVVPPVAIADYFGREAMGSIRGFTEPFVTAGQAIGALLSGLVYDFTESYQLAFIVMASVGILAIALTITAKAPDRKR
jgi:MFS family permease